MRLWRMAAALAAAVCAILPTDGRAQDLTLKRVLLSTGGVGYFEYEARVDGDAELALDVGLAQVDDVLKSVVVYDDTGRVGTIRLPGRTPLEEVFRELPFTRDALASTVSLLDALRGAEVEVKGARAVRGRILAVTPETTTLRDGQATVTRHRLSLMTTEGIRQLILEDTDLLEFSDPRLAGDVERALAALAELGERDRRTLRVSVAGDGPRTVRVAYLVEAPLWKATYRLTMPADPLAATADLQGWAVLENLSGKDWNEIELTIVSGNPVTFRQALYDAYYVERPEVPVEVLGRLAPRADEGSLELDAQARRGARAKARPAPVPPGRAMAEPMAAPPAAARDGDSATAVPEAARIVAAESSEATSYVLFRHPGPVSVANGYSLAVPIVGRGFAAERIALYQPQTHAAHPLAAVRVDNDSATALPPGILTLYERGADGRVAHVGDATMKTLPVGESRLLSYALDQKVRIDREDRSRERIATAKIAGGLLVLTRRHRAETLYRIRPPEQEGRRLVIEHPRMSGWDLVEPAPEGVELTAGHYRIGQRLEPGEAVELDVVLQRTERQDVRLSTLDRGQIAYYAGADALSAQQRSALSALAGKLAAIEDAEARAARQEERLQALYEDQQRLRQNLGSVPKDSDLYQRYLKQMTADEDEIEAVRARLDEARSAVEVARRDMLDYVRSLDL